MIATEPLVTVCIPTYNRPELLRESLRSVLWQSYRNIEVIVSDNASTTDTVGVVESFGDSRIRIDRLDENIGLFGNLSRALVLGSGKYRMMLPDDDLMLPGNLERKVAFFEAYPEVGLVHSAFRLVDGNSLPYGPSQSWTGLQHDTVQPGRAFIAESIAQGGIVCVSSVLLRSELVADEKFDEADGPYCDLALWLRVALRSDVGFLPDALSGYRVHASSASSAFQTHKVVRNRVVATSHHVDALKLAHGRFVQRLDLDPATAAELQASLEATDRQKRLSIAIRRWVPASALRIVPPGVLTAAKKTVRRGPAAKAPSALLHSA